MLNPFLLHNLLPRDHKDILYGLKLSFITYSQIIVKYIPILS